MIGLRRASVYVAVLAAILGLWWTMSATGAVKPLLLAAPPDVVQVLRGLTADRSALFGPIGVTLQESMTAFAIGVALALVIGLLVGSSRRLREAYEPLITSVNAVPLIILYPILAAALGIGGASKITVGGIYAFFPTAIATITAMSTLDRRLIAATQSLGANRRQLTRMVIAPLVLPTVIAGMRVSLGLSIVTVIAAEFISGDSGVGYELGHASQSLDTPGLFAWVVIACALTIVINLAYSTTVWIIQKGIHR